MSMSCSLLGLRLDLCTMPTSCSGLFLLGLCDVYVEQLMQSTLRLRAFVLTDISRWDFSKSILKNTKYEWPALSKWFPSRNNNTPRLVGQSRKPIQ
ncbi:hypothetical protein B0H10DRAFT_1328635 [Mycena sp. CBHHK59/15]|nr:hypothetical protein B0H10DRAFT_1328635 [Mycena sp. CBHHK59/15]